MITLDHAEVTWHLNAYCNLKCAYCRPEWSNGTLDRSIDQYLTVVKKLQNTRYQHHSKILWKIGGGEPLHFPNLSVLLKAMRGRTSIIRLETSGDDTYFSFHRVAHYVDQLKLTYHSWQNDEVIDFILEQCQEKNISVSMVVPLAPGLIFESRAKVDYFKNLGYPCTEQILYDNDGVFHPSYSRVDCNRIQGKPDDWEPEFVEPDPNYVDLSSINDVDPVYTGLPCYAGVDWLHINPRGFASYSRCGGRSEHYNVFDPNWQPPNDFFNCTMNQCRSEKDRSKIRIAGN